MLHQNRWVSQEELMEHVLESNANPVSNVVRMHISSLRKKLREALSGDPIQTKVGQGYRLMEDSEPRNGPILCVCVSLSGAPCY